MGTKFQSKYCPRVGCSGVGVRQGEIYVCRDCGGQFDDDPDEGGSHYADPTRRIENQDERRAKRFQRRQLRRPV